MEIRELYEAKVYLEKLRDKHQKDFLSGVKRGADQEQLENIMKKKRYMEISVEAVQECIKRKVGLIR